MGRVVEKILCTVHEENTPSCAVYEDGSTFCFGCGVASSAGSVTPTLTPLKPLEDVAQSIEKIMLLPTINHRGLEFKHDNTGYYILWPNREYYKLRYWAPPPGRGKYYNPSGVSRPNFILNIGIPGPLWVVEGEINALSIASVTNDTIVSPGGVTNFTLKRVGQGLTPDVKYHNLVIVVDDDDVGISAALSLKKEILEYVPDVRIIAMHKGRDANEILSNEGKEALKEALGLPTRVSSD